MINVEKKEARQDKKIFRDMIRRHKAAMISGPGDDDDDENQEDLNDE